MRRIVGPLEDEGAEGDGVGTAEEEELVSDGIGAGEEEGIAVELLKSFSRDGFERARLERQARMAMIVIVFFII